MNKAAEPSFKSEVEVAGDTAAQQSKRARLVRIWRRLKVLSTVVFSFRRRGFDTPIALVLLFTVFPVLLLFQQNQLIREQGSISDQQRQIMNTQSDISRQQTELIKLQALAEQSNMYRQLQLDINGINRVRGHISTAKGAYDERKNATVRVKGSLLLNESRVPFDFDVKAQNFELSLCDLPVLST
jgi:hypothetical protein